MNEDSDLFIVAVGAIVVRNDKILIMKRSDKKDAGPGIWETLSGRVHHGEDPYDAIVRETQEECALEVEINPTPIDLYMAKRLHKPMLLIIYRAQFLEGDVKLSEEHSEYKWSTIEEFSALTPLKRLVQSAKKALGLDGHIPA